MKWSSKISIITVNYNGYNHTCGLIESLRDHLSQSYELIVVDNGSRRDEAVMLQKVYSHVKCLRSEVNLGFAGGNNLGIKHASGEYILLLNNDTFIEDDSIHALTERLDSDSNIGVVSPKIRFAFGPRNIQFAGYTPLSIITLRNALIGFDTPDNGQYDTPRNVPYAHGAAMMFRREVLARAGEMPQIYFLYYEELDWCTKIVDAGFQIWYEPRCTVFHKESATTGMDSELRVRLITRNRLLYAWRNRTSLERIASVAYQILVAAPKNSVTYCFKGQFIQACAVWRGCSEFFKIKDK